MALGSSQDTCSPGGNETNLLTRSEVSTNRGWMTNMLVISSSVRVFNWILRHTSDTRPRLVLDLVLVVGSSCLQQWLINTASSSDHPNDSTAMGVQSLSGTRWVSNTGLLTILGMSNDHTAASGCPGNLTTIHRMSLNSGNDSSFRTRSEGEQITRHQCSRLSGLDVHTGVQTLYADPSVLQETELVPVPEHNLAHRGATARLVEDLLDNSSNLVMPLREIEWTELGWSLLVSVSVLESWGLTPSADQDYLTHGDDFLSHFLYTLGN